MFITRNGSRLAAARPSTFQPKRLSRRWYALERTQIKIPNAPRPAPPFPVIESCPSPTCQCREMPAGLDIEREQNLNGSMAAYAEQVLISTGKSDWKSRIEEEEGVHGEVVRGLKGLLGPKGKFSDPYHNVLLTASSFAPTPSTTANHESASAFLLPSFTYVPHLPSNDPATLENLVKGFILPSKLHQQHDSLTREQQNVLKRQPELQKRFPDARRVDDLLILICGHGGRDHRCGTVGPILQSEFEDKLGRQNVPVLVGPPEQKASERPAGEGYQPSARIGLISHIGGHKWAGNVILYFPPGWTGHALAGKGIWYGRVEPGNVEGIVEKTVMGGKVIADLFRGGIDSERNVLRL